MVFKGPMIVVRDIEKATAFYTQTLGLQVIADFGENVTLTGGFSLQEKKLWQQFINKGDGDIVFGGNEFELYFEEDDFDGFIQKLSKIGGINYIGGVSEASWGQRAVRFRDVDGHIIEVGENLTVVTRRFLDSGMTIEETAKCMDVPAEFVRSCVKNKQESSNKKQA